MSDDFSSEFETYSIQDSYDSMKLNNPTRNDINDSRKFVIDGLTKFTKISDQRIEGYQTSVTLTGAMEEIVEVLNYHTSITDVQKKIVNIWDEILDQNNDSIAKENLIAIINDSLEELWTFRSFREREFKKYIVLLQTITKSEQLNDKPVDLLKEFGFLFQTLKIPKITRQDIKSAKKVITKLGLDLYAPFKSKPKYQLTIKELNE